MAGVCGHLCIQNLGQENTQSLHPSKFAQMLSLIFLLRKVIAETSDNGNVFYPSGC